MAQMEVDIKFSTNAKIVKQQIRELNSQIGDISTSAARLSSQIDANKATSKNLTGDIRARQSILKLDAQINHLAEQRTKMAMGNAQFGAQQQYIKGLIKTNEVMRIQRKIIDDNAMSWVNLGKNTQWAGRQLVVGFTVPLTIAAGAAMKAFSDLEKELVKFKRVYGDVNTTVQQTQDAAEGVKKLSNEWVKFGVAISDTVGLAAEAAGAGFQGEQLFAQVEQANKLAVLGQLEQQKAMSATIALQSTFKMSNQDLAKSINFLNQLENQTMVTMDDMTTAIPKAATVVEGLGGSVEDLGVMMAALREGGVSAAEGANALKSGLGSLLNPSKAAEESLNSIGVNLPKMWKASEENGKGVIYVLEELSKGLDNLGSTKKQQVMEELFGKHQFARMNALLSNINKGTQALQAKEVAAATPLERALTAQKELNKLGESSLTKFQSAVQELKAAIAPLGKIIMDVVTPLIEFGTKVADKFNDLPDIVKQISLGFVGLAGIVAPLFLMLLGQVQNLIGNGLKLINWIRNWGKDTKWVNQENLDLANAIGVVNAKLIAENALLIENTALWERQQAAAASATATTGGAVAGPVIAPRGRGRKKFARGGSVGGGDSVPALLTPGEFVVNKKSAKRFGNVLSAMNSGNLKGFSEGTESVRPGYNWAHMSSEKGPLEADLSTMSPSSQKRVKAILEQLKKLGLSDKEGLAFISNLTRQMPESINAGLNTRKGVPLATLLEEFDNRKVTRKQQPMAQALWSGGMDRKRIINGDFVQQGKTFDSMMKKELKQYGVESINDNQMYAATAKVIDRMGASGGPDGEFAAYLAKANHQVGNVRLRFAGKVLEKLAAFNAEKSAAEQITPESIGVRHGSRGPKLNPIFGNRSYRSFGKRTMWQRLFMKFADGGFVPGQGNKDTVPAMLAPGEAVINKKASKKFGGILHAMNKGTVGMFAGGYSKEVQGTPLSDAERKQLASVFTNAIDEMTKQMAATFGYGAERAAELKKQIQLDMRAFDAAHVVRETDEAGNKIWRNENLVATPKGENVKMEALSKSEQNLKVLDNTAKEMGIAMDKRTDLIRRLTAQEHIVEQEQRDLLAAIIAEAEVRRVAAQDAGKVLARNQMLSPAFRGESGAAFAGSLGVTPLNYSTRKTMSRADVDALRGQAGSAARPSIIEDETKAVKTRGRFDSSAIGSALFMVPMLLGSVTDVTDSMGALNNALMIAAPAMMMFGGNIPTGGGVKGIFGKGIEDGAAKGIKGAFGKWGLGAGAVGGLVGAGVGSVAGNLIQDQKGGMRDSLGQAASWGLTGAGLGMAFGPWGAAIGAAGGALAGFAVQMVANNKAHDKMTESILTASERWDKASQSLNEQLGLGNNKPLNQLIAGANPGTTPQAQELYTVFKTEFIDKAGTDMHNMVEDMRARLASGRAEGPLTDINTFVMSQRALGTDEADIKIMAQAIIASLPEGFRGGLTPENYQLQTSEDILQTINSSIDRMVAAAPQKTTKSYESVPDAQGIIQTVEVTKKFNDLNLDKVIQNTNALGDATKYLQTEQLNAALAMSQHAKDTKEYKDALKRYTDAMSNLEDARDYQIRLQKAVMAGSPEAQESYFKAQAGQIGEIEKSGAGMGITGEKWEEFVKNAVANGEENSQQLTDAAAMVLQGGIALTDAAGNIKYSAEQIEHMGQLRVAQFNAANVLTAKTEEKQHIQGSLAELQAIIDNPVKQPKEEKTAAGVSRAEAGVNRAQAALDKAQEREDARTHKWDKINQGWTIKNASLDIARIHLEERALKDFVGKFNKAFGTSIDSFADAQYQIEKIGLAIRNIQVKTIAPLQEKADDLRRVNELRGRKLEELQKKEQERVDAINKSYDEQAAVLGRIKDEQEFINDEAAAAAELTGAYATGNITDITKASIGLTKTVNAYGQQQQGRGLEEGRDAQLANSPYKAEIDKLTKDIEATDKSILAIEDQIYNINEKQIEPMQRRSDLMSLMLDTTKSQLEYQKANIKGIDQENLARKEALKTAKESLDNAKHMFDLMGEQKALAAAQKKLAKEQKTIEKEKNVIVDERIKKLQDEYGLEGLSLEQMKSKLQQLEKDATTREKNAKLAVDHLARQMALAEKGSINSVDAWGRPIPADGTSATLTDLMTWAETGKLPNVKRPTYLPPGVQEGTSRPGGSDNSKDNARYTGGPIPGDGGQDSVPTMLTPGEYVMRKSAVDRIGEQNLRRMNQGADTDGLFTGGLVKLATGGAVPEKNFGGVESRVLNALLQTKRVKDAQAAMGAQSVQTGGEGGGGGAEGYIPGGPIPGLAKKEPGPSGYPAEHASWIKRSAVRMMRYVKHAFPSQFTGTTYMSSGEHGSGKAVDYMLRKNYRSAAGKADGWRLAKWATKWRKPLGVRGVIFSDHITGYGRWNGWRPYKHFSGSMSDTDRHRDHNHIINYSKGGLVPGAGGMDSMPSMLTPGEFVVNRNAVNRVGQLPLKKLNAGTSLNPVTNDNVSGGDSVAVYNDYSLIFNVNEQIDTRDMARVVMREIQRATNSQVKQRT